MPVPPLRILDLSAMPEDGLSSAAARGSGLHFSHLLWQGDTAKRIVAAASAQKLGALLRINLSEVALDNPIVAEHPDWFAIRRAAVEGGIVDPRHIADAGGQAMLRYYAAPDAILSWWDDILTAQLGTRLQGFVLDQPQRIPQEAWRKLIAQAKERAPDALLIANTIGLPRGDAAALENCGFDFTLSSLPWWDLTAPWLVEEYETLARVAPVLACISTPKKPLPTEPHQRATRLILGAFSGAGVLACLDGADDGVQAMNDWIVLEPLIATPGALLARSAPGAPVTLLLRTDHVDSRCAQKAFAIAINPDARTATDKFSETMLSDWTASAALPERLAPGEAVFFNVQRATPVQRGFADRTAFDAAQLARVIIENVSPSIDGGVFPAKAIVGSAVTVEADIFTDGHPLLAAELVFRAEDEIVEQRIEMRKGDNDRWSAALPLCRIGRHRFAVQAWLDVYGSFVRDLHKKVDAGRDVATDILEGRGQIERAASTTNGALQSPLTAIAEGFEALAPAERLAILLAPETTAAMRLADSRAFLTQSAIYFLDCDREGAAFANWYELFPRSQTDDPTRHGTFADVITRLPAIRDMGFDVLYMPPIHPIGTTNRKGRNNSLQAGPNDPGSVYAVGSGDGGHDAIHPELGTLEDFRALIAAAREHGLELALDFAVQCSPDHPWLRDHPGWFDWRADGSIKFAENPPKTYEDIVNVDFYARDAVPGLWLALRDIVLFWANAGVRIFRVDNPHTKPFVFWQWLIDDIRVHNPDVIFLAEAFTRPKVMNYLAKLGFTQSYTYFTWRNEKAEITQYMEELKTPPVADFFRPHFFVNTPDINPVFLQQSGRPGFLIRAALAATLSGLWGIYSGFELCEFDPLPGREEYNDSEKYVVKPRDWTAPGNIIAEITQLNRLRKSEPALHSHLGLTFYNAFNPNILYFGKHVPGSATRILVAISTNPHGIEDADFEAPLWEWQLPDSGALAVEDLLSGTRVIWHGKMQHLRLTPDMPYRLWRVSPAPES